MQVSLPECDITTQCVLKRNSRHELVVKFVSPINANNIVADVRANVMNLQLPWPGFNRNPCNPNNRNLDCPLSKGREYEYKLSFDVQPFYPAIRTEATFRLVNRPVYGARPEDIFCFKLPLQLI